MESPVAQSTNPVTSHATPSSAVWEFPSRKLTVHLDFSVIDAINEEVARGFGLVPRRGAEVGGILLGRLESGPKAAVFIEGFDPVACRYETGPSFHLGEQDSQALEAQLARWRSGPDKRLSVVGFYRSHTRKEFAMDEQDAALCAKHFPDPKNVFLLIRPFAGRTSVAGFFFWNNGQLEREPSCQEFVFQRSELGGGYSRPARPARPQDPGAPAAADSPAARPLPQVVEMPARPDTVLPQPEVPEPEPVEPPVAAPPPRRRWVKWIWAPFAAILLAGGAYWWGFAGKPAPASAPAPVKPAAGAPAANGLELSAVENQGQIEVSWNRRSPVVLAAKSGVLTIADGPYRKVMQLDGDQLRNMHKIVYSSVTEDISFSLEVLGERRNASESVRVLKGGSAAQPPPPAEPKPALEATAEPPAPPPAAKPKPATRRPKAAPRPADRAKPEPAVEPVPPAEAPAAPEERVIPKPGRRR